MEKYGNIDAVVTPISREMTPGDIGLSMGSKLRAFVVAAAAAFAISGCEEGKSYVPVQEPIKDVVPSVEGMDTGLRYLGSTLATDGLHMQFYAPAGGDRKVNVYTYQGGIQNLQDMLESGDYSDLGEFIVAIDGKNGELVIPDEKLPSNGIVKVVPQEKDCRYPGMPEYCYDQELNELVVKSNFTPDDFEEIAKGGQ